MWSARRALVAAAALIALIFLLRSSSSPSPQPQAVDISAGEQEEAHAPSRPYPPPTAPKKGIRDQQVVADITSKPLRRRLEYYFPYDVEAKFPAYVWQTWKTSPSSGAFEERLRPLEASWSEKHPGFVHEVIVDNAVDQLINYLYASVPEVTEAWAAMPLPVLKADFFRYLILLARGGIYSDIDTQALKSAVNWLPDDFDRSTVGLVVGIEADPDRPDWNQWYSRRIQLCQWTIQAKPGHPVLQDIVATITEDALLMKRKGQLVQGREPVAKTVMEFTGPGVWTDAVFAYFNNKDYFEFDTKFQNITAKDFFGIRAAKKVGDVIVLPITSFSPGVGQMGAGEPDDPMAFVHHEFDGSWKPESEKMNDE